MYDFKDIHIGTVIFELLKERKIEEERIHNFFEKEVDLEQTYQSRSLDSEELLKWSKLLNYDFFRLYSNHLILYAPISKTEQIENKKIPTFKKNVYTKEIILFILELIKTGNKTKQEVIETYKIPKTTLFRWLKKYENEA